MYNTSDSVPRADISTVLMEAVGQENLFIAQQILPVFPSGTQVGRYPKFAIEKGELLSAETAANTKRNQTGTYNEVTRKFEWDSFQTEEYGLEERVDDVVAKSMESFFDAEVTTGKLLMNNLMLAYEVQAAAAVNDSGTFTTTNSTVAYTEANVSGNTPFDVPRDINDAIERATLLGEPPNVITMSLAVWNRIRRSQKLQTYVYGFLNVTQGGSQITEQMFAQTFGLEAVLISRKSINTAIKGKSKSLTPVWGNDYIGVGRLGEGEFMNGGLGRTIVWDADSPGGLFTSESYRDEKRRGNMIRIRSNRVIKIVNANCLQLIATQWA